MVFANVTGVNTPARKSLWTMLAAGIGVAAWGWHHDHGQRRIAERLAAATLETLLNAVDANDGTTGQHMRRTAAYGLCMAAALDLSDVERRKVERVALFHDIGKIHAALFDIVHDDKRLTPEERLRIATHPERGAQVLTPLAAFYPELPEGVLSHHERWDGTGYPRRLKADRIPFYARIVAIVDTFDAITHSRRYHVGEGPDRGIQAIAEGRGTQFDPSLVDVFMSDRVLANIHTTFEQSRTDHAESRARPGPKRRRMERRTDEGGSSVPDVRFRWRAPSAVVPTDPTVTPTSGV